MNEDEKDTSRFSVCFDGIEYVSGWITEKDALRIMDDIQRIVWQVSEIPEVE